MSDIMRPIPFNELIVRVFSEYRNQNSIFGINKENFYKQGNNHINVFGQDCKTPIGPAAGPHTQLAQNIIASYLVGGRFMELKTVQIMDYLGEKKMISKPCIDARDEGFNVEWSTEYTLEKAYDEYLKAWFLVHVLQALLNGKFDKPDFIFNMSVGYNLEGIKQPKMQTFIDQMIDAEKSPLFNEYKELLKAAIDEEEFISGSDFEKNAKALKGLVSKISSNICKTVTVSTMHGCPPQEIEAICSYMLKEKHLNTFVKLNPTLLGYEKVRSILDATGFDYVELKHESFDHDLQVSDAFAMLHRLVDLAKSLKLGFGVKLTNTLANVNNEKIFEGDERYMSGRALLPISTSVAALISKEFEGKLPISYSGGADIHSIGMLFDCGIKPITLATDMLKPGGYNRMKAMACLLDSTTIGWKADCVNAIQVKELSEKAIGFDFAKKDFRGTDVAKTNDELPMFNCFVSPCQEACPIHQCIPDYVSLVSDGRYEEALELIYKDNALPNITCNICDHQCQLHCSRMDYEGAISIRNIKKIAIEQGSASYYANLKKVVKPNGVKVAVVGAGPAGLSSAYFLSRSGFDVTVFEKEKNAGGVVANIIPKFRIDSEAIEADINHIEKLGAKFVFGTNNEQVKVDNLKKDGFKYIFYAIGAEKGNVLKLDGDYSKVIDGLDFLREFKENKAKLGKNVVVVGAGNSAMDCARAAKRCSGVEKVSIVYRRSIKEMPAAYEEYLEAVEEGVEFNFLTNPSALNSNVLTCSKMKLGDVDASGRRSPVETGENTKIDCDNLILALGEHVDSDLVSSFGIPINEKGWPVVDPDTNETKIKDVFAVGDMSSGPSTVVRCISSARKAVDKVCKDLNILQTEDDNTVEDSMSDDDYFEEEDRFFNRIQEKKTKLFINRTKVVEDFKKFAKQEEGRCMNCSYLCSKCVDVCPNRANVAIDMRFSENSYDAFQIIHLDAYCNECGNCASFCNHNGRPYKDKFTLFSREDDFASSKNQGFYVEGSEIKVRFNNNVVDCRIDGNGNVCGDIPVLIKEIIEEVFISYGYLLGRVDE